jgi:trans-aconitate 2-methyltransferase
MSDLWNATTYSHFLDARTRPARDLLAAIPTSFHPATVCDLGCGPGNSTILLKDRWPNAQIVGLDNSADMLQAAKSAHPDIEFMHADIAAYAPREKVDCLFSNAALHWLPHHEKLIPALMKNINAGGVLAIQMPNNFHAPSHQVAIEILLAHAKWTPLLQKLFFGKLSECLFQLRHYYDLLVRSGGSDLQCWETEYYQEMKDGHEIFNWVSGSGIRPVLTVMSENERMEFAEEYVREIALRYPRQANGKILFPFRRVFLVCKC